MKLQYGADPRKPFLVVAASMLTAAYHILKHGTTYHDLGPDYFERQSNAHITRRLIRRLAALGFSVEARPAA